MGIVNDSRERSNAGKREASKEAAIILKRLDDKRNAGKDPKNIAEVKAELDK